MTILPTDNDWGVPCLDPALQPTSIPAPVLHWGSRARGTVNTGTWSFYVDDCRFTASTVDTILRTRCAAVTELNFTVREYTSRAEVLWRTWEKRRIAALLLACGVGVFVDICVPSEHRDLSMLGVPLGWRAFATRGFAARPDELRDEHRFACDWAGRQPLLLVVGGGATIRAVCAELPGAVWCAGHQPRSSNGER